MPRVHTQKANKDYPEHGIKKGDTYYSWTFRYGGMHRSKTYPRPSQLTQGKLSTAYAAQEALDDAVAAASGLEEIVSALNDCASEIRDVSSEYSDSLDAMPTQEGPVAEGIQEKIDALDAYADELESAATEVEQMNAEEYCTEEEKKPTSFDELNEEDQQEMLSAAREIATGVSLEV